MIKHTSTILTFLVVFIFGLKGFSQRNADDIAPLQISKPSDAATFGTKTLEANFLVKDRFGISPLTIQFKGMSTGAPDKWNWTFGDGTTDTIKNPLHTYEEPGLYTVKLSVQKSGVSSSITREDYVYVTAEGACDTLAFPLQGDYSFYEIIENGFGYVSGNNSYGDLAKASYFDDFPPESMLIGGVFDFVVAKKSLASNLPVTFVAWESDEITNSPAGVLAETQLPLAQIEQEVGWDWSTLVFFENPPPIHDDFFLGLKLPQMFGDTLALFTNLEGDVEVGNAWEQHDNGNWYAYANPNYSWGINIDHAIFPLICQTTGISNHYLDNQLLIYPIPANDRINIVILDRAIEAGQLSLIDLAGRLVYDHRQPLEHSTVVDVSHLKEGVYILRFNVDGVMAHRKVIIGR